MITETILNQARQRATQIYNILQPYCKSIYLGGSYTQDYIEHPHDIDFICFASNELDRLKMQIKLNMYKSRHKNEFQEDEDWIQTRRIDKEEHSYGSYIHKDMILLAGNPVTLTFHPKRNDRAEYIKILKKYSHIDMKLKRYYQLYRGYLLAFKKSYDLTDEEKIKLNILHDAQTEKDLIRTIPIESDDEEEEQQQYSKIHIFVADIKLAIWGLR